MLVIDFVHGKMGFRRKQATTKNEAVAKAVGLKKGTPCKIIDTTAGLGQDAFILACLGADVTLLERSPPIAALLKDGLERAMQSDDIEVKNIIESRMHLIEIDARDYLSTLAPNQYPDVIYCDPMFPERQKSALVKKEMQYLQSILNHSGQHSDRPLHNPDPDSAELLALSLKIAKKRVVVKRPRLAPTLPGPKPDFSHDYKSNRFDVYLKKSL